MADISREPSYIPLLDGIPSDMAGTTRSGEELDARRRKLLFRSWHRGIREMDLVLGGFADAGIRDLNEAELDQYERLLEIQDADLLSWVTGETPAPEAHTALLKKIMAARPAWVSATVST